MPEDEQPKNPLYRVGQYVDSKPIGNEFYRAGANGYYIVAVFPARKPDWGMTQPDTCYLVHNLDMYGGYATDDNGNELPPLLIVEDACGPVLDPPTPTYDIRDDPEAAGKYGLPPAPDSAFGYTIGEDADILPSKAEKSYGFERADRPI